MHKGLIVLWVLLCSIASAAAQVSVGIGFPGVNIGINLPVYPELVPVPGYPVYYAPQVSSNYFFYDGLYWVYRGDNWYASSWYNGPWGLVAPEAVPLFILRVPVRYYRQPPVYFRGWRSDAPPRWGEHWGNSWEQRRRGWDTWNRSSVPAPAPLPVYQRQYSGSQYPRVEQQQVLQSQNYRYQPRETVVQQQYQTQRVQSVPAPSPQQRPRAEPQRVQGAPHAFFAAKGGSDSGTIIRAAGPTRFQSGFFASASRATGTAAANGKRRRSEAGHRPHAASAERPERPASPGATSGGPARAAGNAVARPGQRTARQGPPAGAWPEQGPRERRAARRGTQQMRLHG
jgi:hypothetical protein